jgi:hypothetical protein
MQVHGTLKVGPRILYLLYTVPMIDVISGLLSFFSLVVSLLAFRRDRFVIGWIGVVGFFAFMAIFYIRVHG